MVRLVIERTFKEIAADGDYGPVKDRIRIDKEVPKLTIRALELLEANLPDMYPATDLDTTTTPGTGELTGTLSVASGDYHTVTWTGELATGKSAIITIENAINMNNIDWSLIDKDEIVSELVFTGTYLETARTTPPWKIEYVTP